MQYTHLHTREILPNFNAFCTRFATQKARECAWYLFVVGSIHTCGFCYYALARPTTGLAWVAFRALCRCELQAAPQSVRASCALWSTTRSARWGFYTLHTHTALYPHYARIHIHRQRASARAARLSAKQVALRASKRLPRTDILRGDVVQMRMSVCSVYAVCLHCLAGIKYEINFFIFLNLEIKTNGSKNTDLIICSQFTYK